MHAIQFRYAFVHRSRRALEKVFGRQAVLVNPTMYRERTSPPLETARKRYTSAGPLRHPTLRRAKKGLAIHRTVGKIQAQRRKLDQLFPAQKASLTPAMSVNDP